MNAFCPKRFGLRSSGYTIADRGETLGGLSLTLRDLLLANEFSEINVYFDCFFVYLFIYLFHMKKYCLYSTKYTKLHGIA